MYPTQLAAALEREGNVVDGLGTIESALQSNSEIRIFLPESLRIRGLLRLKQSQMGLAEVDFRSSIAFARSMNAKTWELRATMSLARLLEDTDRREEARTMLADIYDWFTEGFDTADLIDAKALLEQLSD